jgi:hypothetical protein
MEKMKMDIYYVLRECLNWGDFHRLLSSAKELFQLMKRYTILFPLGFEFTQKFLDPAHERWKSELLDLVDNPEQQIELSFFKNSEKVISLFDIFNNSQYFLRSCDERYSRGSITMRIKYGELKQVEVTNKITSVINLCIKPAKEIADYDSLKNMSIPNIINHDFYRSNVSFLSCVKRISIFHSSCLTDVSCLSGTRFVELVHCSSLKNLNGLKNIHTLILNGCFNLEDVSKLVGINSVNIANCAKLRCYKSLHKCKIVSFWDQQFVDLSVFSTATQLEVLKCSKIKSFKFAAGTVRRVKFIAPQKSLMTKNRFDCCEEVNIYGCQFEFDFCSFCRKQNAYFLMVATSSRRWQVSVEGKLNTFPLLPVKILPISSHCQTFVMLS